MARGNITVVEQVYHQIAGEDPVGTDMRYERSVESDEQVYKRALKVGNDWKPLEFGWVERVGMILLVNPKTVFEKNPTPEEQAQADQKTVEVSLSPEADNILLIPPGESLRITALRTDTIRVRCRADQTKVTLYAYPE